MNREGPGSFIRAGSGLAIELAADRAFGPNRRLQHGLLEVALGVFDERLSPQRLSVVLGHIQRLTTDDQQEIVLPLLRRRLDLLSVDRLGPVVEVIQSINPADAAADTALEKMASTPSLRAEAVKIFLASARSISCDGGMLSTLVGKLDAQDLDELLTGTRGEQLFTILQCLRAAELSADLLSHAVATLCRFSGFAFVGRENFEFLRTQITQPWPVDPIEQVIRCLLIHGYLSRHDDWSGINKSDHGWDLTDITIPDPVRDGSIGDIIDNEPFASSPPMQLAVWMVHLLLGNVTTQSAVEFVDFFRAHRRHGYLIGMFTPLWPEAFPCFDALMALARFKTRPPWTRMTALLEQFAGNKGRVAWNSIRARLQLEKPANLRRDRPKMLLYGFFGIADAKRRSYVIHATDSIFGDLLAEYIFFRRSAPYPDVDETDSLERLITTIARDRILTTPRALAIRRACNRRALQSRLATAQCLRLLEVLIDIRCGTLMPDVVAVVLTVCLQSDELLPDVARAALDAIKLPHDRPLLLLPRTVMDSALLYRRLVEISVETTPSSTRHCARLLVMSLAETRFHVAGAQFSTSAIRFAGFADLHRSLAEAQDPEARLTALALFAARRPSSAKDWRLLADLVVNCRSRAGLTILRYIGLSNWDDPETIDQSIAFLMGVIPRVSVVEVTWLLAEWLEVLISKSSQSLGLVEKALGLPLQAQPGFMTD